MLQRAYRIKIPPSNFLCLFPVPALEVADKVFQISRFILVVEPEVVLHSHRSMFESAILSNVRRDGAISRPGIIADEGGARELAIVHQDGSFYDRGSERTLERYISGPEIAWNILIIIRRMGYTGLMN